MATDVMATQGGEASATMVSTRNPQYSGLGITQFTPNKCIILQYDMRLYTSRSSCRKIALLNNEIK